ncbi:hypothetical protein LGM71_03690 [Burkholderia sp. AU33545]|uniref:hypothetical protein n=1 Tax=unclassified Burkholderia TaxID=2613784 RepID=UPI001CF118D3|nr:hypothetical protein [Burkholderia sp. AU33545]MCA8200153.1 hypothetical protein [Burkholderia sp. AU33545]
MDYLNFRFLGQKIDDVGLQEGVVPVVRDDPFWSVYFNGLGVAIANALEDQRDPHARSYRFRRDGTEELFDRSFSWRSFREATVAEARSLPDDAIVVQTDVSSFYEHVSHH